MANSFSAYTRRTNAPLTQIRKVPNRFFRTFSYYRHPMKNGVIDISTDTSQPFLSWTYNLYIYIYCACVYYSFVSLSESNSSCWHCASHRHQGQHKTIIITGYTADDGSPSSSFSRRRQSSIPHPHPTTVQYIIMILYEHYGHRYYIYIAIQYKHYNY